jgi:hypothetical protein
MVFAFRYPGFWYHAVTESVFALDQFHQRRRSGRGRFPGVVGRFFPEVVESFSVAACVSE